MPTAASSASGLAGRPPGRQGRKAKAQPAAFSEKFPQGSFPRKFAPLTGGRTVWQAGKGKVRPPARSAEGPPRADRRPLRRCRADPPAWTAPPTRGPSCVREDDEPDSRQAAPGHVGEALAVAHEPRPGLLVHAHDRMEAKVLVAAVAALDQRSDERLDERGAVLPLESRILHGSSHRPLSALPPRPPPRGPFATGARPQPAPRTEGEPAGPEFPAQPESFPAFARASTRATLRRVPGSGRANRRGRGRGASKASTGVAQVGPLDPPGDSRPVPPYAVPGGNRGRGARGRQAESRIEMAPMRGAL